MKGTKILISVVCVVLMVMGWFSYLGSIGDAEAAYEALVKQGDKYMEQKLYQRAILEYEGALEYQDSVKLRTKIVNAYKGRYLELKSLKEEEMLEEDADFGSKYAAALEKAAQAYKEEAAFVVELIDLYSRNELYAEAYQWTAFAEENGIDLTKHSVTVIENEEEKTLNLQEAKLRFRYNFVFKSRAYQEISPAFGGMISYKYNDTWSYMLEDMSAGSDNKYEYVSVFNDDGVHVLTFTKDSRLMGADKFVMGIFQEKIYEAGIFAEGLIPAKAADGKWYYYDELAKVKFGGYEYAGMFQDGKAAVKTAEGWYFVDTEGKKADKTVYSDIALDAYGRYMSTKEIVVAAKDGKYKIYNADMKAVSDKSWDGARCCYADGMIAVKQDGKWGFVNIKGETVIKAQYDDAQSFCNTMAAVKMGGKWGYINEDNELAIQYQFEDAQPFMESGCCMVLVQEAAEEGSEPVLSWYILKLKMGLG